MGFVDALSGVFGLETNYIELKNGEATEYYLSFHLALFRFACLPKGRIRPVMFLAAVATFVIAVCTIVAKYDTIKGCEQDTLASIAGERDEGSSSCVVSYIFNGFHFMHFISLIFFMLVVLNGYCYGESELRRDLPKSIILQWVLFIILLPLSITSLAGFEILSHAKDKSMTVFPSMRAANSTCMLFLNLFGLMGYCEIKGRHIILSTTVLLIHFLVMTIMDFAGIQVYPNFFYTAHRLDEVAVALVVLHVILHCTWFVIQRYKIRAILGSIWLPVTEERIYSYGIDSSKEVGMNTDGINTTSELTLPKV